MTCLETSDEVRVKLGVYRHKEKRERNLMNRTERRDRQLREAHEKNRPTDPGHYLDPNDFAEGSLDIWKRTA